jgi:hypothetical protein
MSLLNIRLAFSLCKPDKAYFTFMQCSCIPLFHSKYIYGFGNRSILQKSTHKDTTEGVKRAQWHRLSVIAVVQMYKILHSQSGKWDRRGQFLVSHLDS